MANENQEQVPWKVVAENDDFRLERMNDECKLISKGLDASPIFSEDHGMSVDVITIDYKYLKSLQNLFNLADENRVKHEEKIEVDNDSHT